MRSHIQRRLLHTGRALFLDTPVASLSLLVDLTGPTLTNTLSQLRASPKKAPSPVSNAASRKSAPSPASHTSSPSPRPKAAWANPPSPVHHPTLPPSPLLSLTLSVSVSQNSQPLPRPRPPKSPHRHPRHRHLRPLHPNPLLPLLVHPTKPNTPKPTPPPHRLRRQDHVARLPPTGRICAHHLARADAPQGFAAVAA